MNNIYHRNVMNQTNEVSYLYNLQPIASGTGYCEGLLSYLTRLSQAHHLSIGTLIKQIIIPTFNREYMLKDALQGCSRFYERSKSINGVSKFSYQMVETLQNLTKTTDLQNLTFIPWKQVISDKYLMRRTKAWCSSCINEWREENETIYEPLVWSLNDMTTCPIHTQRLNLNCPNSACNKEVPVIARKLYIGYCPSCLTWLGDKPTKSVCNGDFERELWISNELYELISDTNNTKAKPDRNNIQKSFEKLLLITDGSIPRLADTLHLHRSNIWQYCTGKYIPPLRTILMICFHYKISLVDFLIGKDFIPIIKSYSSVIATHKSLPQKLCMNDIEKKLEELKMITPPQSLNKIAKLVGLTPKTLSKNFPILAMEIKTDYRSFRTATREKNEIKTCSHIASAVLKLTNEGVYPGRRNVENFLDRPGILQRPLYKRVWQEHKKLALTLVYESKTI